MPHIQPGEKQPGEKQPQYINSVSRAIRVLELYGRQNAQSLSLAEIAKALGLQKTTAFNIVKTLAREGWLVQEGPGGKYRLGTRILRVSTAVVRGITTEDLILEEMHRLRDKYNEDVVLIAMMDGLPICVEKLQSTNVLRVASKVGRMSNLLKGSTGKALFAWQTPEFIENTLAQTFGEGAEEEKEAVRREVARIRAQGWCISLGEQDPGVASVAVPIRDSRGVASYSLAILGEENRMRQKGMDGIRDELMATARRLEKERGFIRG